MNKLLCTTALTLFSYSIIQSADISRAHHEQQVVKKFDELLSHLSLKSQLNPAKSLTTIDLDHTVFVPKNAPQAGGEMWFRGHLSEHNGNLERTLHQYRKLQQFLRVEPADDSVIPTIRTLQEAGFPVFALTARGPEIAKHTARMLQEMGLSFKTTNIPQLEENINDLQNPFLYASNGVVHAPKGKGDALVKILEACNLNPEELVHIDDSEKHLVDISTKIRDQYPSTQFTGLLYQGCQHLEQSYDHAATQPVVKTWHGRYLPHVRR